MSPSPRARWIRAEAAHAFDPAARVLTALDRLGAAARSVVVPGVVGVALLLGLIAVVGVEVGGVIVEIADGPVAAPTGGADLWRLAGEDAAGRDARARELLDAVAIELHGEVVVVAGLIGAAVALLCWWLATAYRCLPLHQRRIPVARAFGVGRTAVGGTIALAIGLAVARGPAADAPFVGLLVVLGIAAGVLVALYLALRHAAAMLGDVTFAFADGHFATATVLRRCIDVGAVLLVASTFLSAVDLDADARGFAVALAVAWLGLALTAAVALVTYVGAIAVATCAIEDALRAGATELQHLAAAGLVEEPASVGR